MTGYFLRMLVEISDNTRDQPVADRDDTYGMYFVLYILWSVEYEDSHARLGKSRVYRFGFFGYPSDC